VNFRKALFRAWFYFRTGYNLYLAFLIGFASNIVVLYRLGVTDNKYLAPIFPSLSLFTILALVIALPLGILAGLYHMKRTGAFAADASVATEANPYIYKVVPGKEKEVFLPLWILTVRGLAKMLDQQKTMTPEERENLQELLSKADSLLGGEYVGLPREQGVRNIPVTEGDK
jgi:ABC-type antimicrobial peptide transport system permease subunit